MHIYHVCIYIVYVYMFTYIFLHKCIYIRPTAVTTALLSLLPAGGSPVCVRVHIYIYI